MVHNLNHTRVKIISTDEPWSIAKLDDQVTALRKSVEESSAVADHYMALSVEMRTHIKAIVALGYEAERCFLDAPYRKNTAMPAKENPTDLDQKPPLPKFLDK